MPYDDILVHEARPVVSEQIGDWINGEPDVEPTPGIAFACCLFLPASPEESGSPRGARAVRRPTLLCSDVDAEENPVDLRPTERLLVVAEELTGPDPVLWEVEGIPQPFGRPGSEIIGKQATLKRVEEAGGL